eukprot:TRINITY_DN80486_c0_g1_i2.p3 TRINITY_DN80486_c0_g1~~TRINITY_DN80486_c0_g1_i2.p3  ORF type:complete len:126 (-),score=9.12 TRINITY_DN80486_c0_g1_i2:70-447(-)
MLFIFFILLLGWQKGNSFIPQQFPDDVNVDKLVSVSGKELQVERCCIRNCTVMEYVGNFTEGVNLLYNNICEFGNKKAGMQFAACYGLACLYQEFNSEVRGHGSVPMHLFFPSFTAALEENIMLL